MFEDKKKEVTTDKVEKRERVSFSGSRRRLDGTKFVDPDFEKKFFLHWSNDEKDNLQRAETAGYEYVRATEIVGHVGDKEVHGDNSDLNGRVSKMSKVGDDPVRIYLMKQPMEFHLEDVAAKEAVNDKVDDAIRAGTSGGASAEHTYGDGVSLTRS
jgi:hypothetical protein